MQLSCKNTRPHCVTQAGHCNFSESVSVGEEKKKCLFAFPSDLEKNELCYRGAVRPGDVVFGKNLEE